MGSVELVAAMEEDFSCLYGRSPYECPPRPPDPLNMAMFQVHLSRLSGLGSDIRSVIAAYSYVVSWQNPAITFLSLVLFVRFCFRFDPAYVGSLPFYFLLLWMLYLAFARSKGRIKEKLLRKELDAYRKVCGPARNAAIVELAPVRTYRLTSSTSFLRLKTSPWTIRYTGQLVCSL